MVWNGEEECDWDCYLNDYSDLKDVFGSDHAKAEEHYRHWGFREGRTCTCINAYTLRKDGYYCTNRGSDHGKGTWSTIQSSLDECAKWARENAYCGKFFNWYTNGSGMCDCTKGNYSSQCTYKAWSGGIAVYEWGTFDHVKVKHGQYCTNRGSDSGKGDWSTTVFTLNECADWVYANDKCGDFFNWYTDRSGLCDCVKASDNQCTYAAWSGGIGVHKIIKERPTDPPTDPPTEEETTTVEPTEEPCTASCPWGFEELVDSGSAKACANFVTFSYCWVCKNLKDDDWSENFWKWNMSDECSHPEATEEPANVSGYTKVGTGTCADSDRNSFDQCTASRVVDDYQVKDATVDECASWCDGEKNCIGITMQWASAGKGKCSMMFDDGNVPNNQADHCNYEYTYHKGKGVVEATAKTTYFTTCWKRDHVEETTTVEPTDPPTDEETTTVEPTDPPAVFKFADVGVACERRLESKEECQSAFTELMGDSKFKDRTVKDQNRRGLPVGCFVNEKCDVNKFDGKLCRPHYNAYVGKRSKDKAVWAKLLCK